MLLEQPDHAEHHRELDRRRVHVVGGLAAVHIIDRVEVLVLAEFVTENLETAVGDHLVGVHVGRRSRAALDNTDRELVVQGTADDLLADLIDEVGLGRVENPEFAVGAR